MNKPTLKTIIREELGKILREETESVQTVADEISNKFFGGHPGNVEVQTLKDGTNFIVFTHKKGNQSAGGFNVDELNTLASLLKSSYPKSTLGTHSELPGVVSIKIIE
jgi:hypothetical protein